MMARQDCGHVFRGQDHLDDLNPLGIIMRDRRDAAALCVDCFIFNAQILRDRRTQRIPLHVKNELFLFGGRGEVFDRLPVSDFEDLGKCLAAAILIIVGVRGDLLAAYDLRELEGNKTFVAVDLKRDA